MKKETTEMVQVDTNDMRAEYDFAEGVRGKHHKAMQAGYTITIRKADGTTVVKDIAPQEGLIMLEPDVREHFSDSDSVNAALRSLIKLIPTKGATITNKVL